MTDQDPQPRPAVPLSAEGQADVHQTLDLLDQCIQDADAIEASYRRIFDRRCRLCRVPLPSRSKHIFCPACGRYPKRTRKMV